MSTDEIIVIAIITFLHQNLILLKKHPILSNYKRIINYRKNRHYKRFTRYILFLFSPHISHSITSEKTRHYFNCETHFFFHSHLFIIPRSRTYYLCLFERVRNRNREPKIDIRQLERIGRNSDFIYTYNFSP